MSVELTAAEMAAQTVYTVAAMMVVVMVAQMAVLMADVMAVSLDGWRADMMVAPLALP